MYLPGALAERRTQLSTRTERERPRSRCFSFVRVCLPVNTVAVCTHFRSCRVPEPLSPAALQSLVQVGLHLFPWLSSRPAATGSPGTPCNSRNRCRGSPAVAWPLCPLCHPADLPALHAWLHGHLYRGRRAHDTAAGS
uniref:Uncharacterized protein n=1 Tax=Molossus molossus TaxID=27622 RepID=A0A7J8FS60_MOLMO|nr:hypothetical protein HJG59_008444 [Molossus molossus]